MAMKVKVLEESGFEEALYGMALSHSLTVAAAVTDKKISRAGKLAHMQGGHNKFLESMYIWMEVTAPRYWWAQADTYRMSTKQSESTMHTLKKSGVNQSMFAEPLPEGWLEDINEKLEAGNLQTAKAWLPEGFLQKRIWCLSYKTLQNVYHQRRKHRLKEWRVFCEEILPLLQHPEYISNEL